MSQNAVSDAAGLARKRTPLWRQPDKWLAGYLFVGPAGILIILFSVISIGVSLYLSFFDYDIIVAVAPFWASETIERPCSRTSCFGRRW